MSSTRTTEIVCRRELRPIITTGAAIMDELFTGTSHLTTPAATENPCGQSPITGSLTSPTASHGHPADPAGHHPT